MPPKPQVHRTRINFINSTINNYVSVLNKNDAENGFIHPEVSRRNREIVSNLTIPSSRNGVLCFEKSTLQNKDFIPVWPMTANERYRLSGKVLAPTPLQKVLTRAALLDLNVHSDDADAITHSPRKRLPLSLHERSAACVQENAIFGKASNDTFVYLRGRPVLAFDASYTDSGLASPVPFTALLHHELIHVSQVINNPVHCIKNKGEYEDILIADEIEAYLHQSDITSELSRQGYENSSLVTDESGQKYENLLALLEAVRHISNIDPASSSADYTVDYRSEVVRTARENRLAEHILVRVMSENERSQPLY